MIFDNLSRLTGFERISAPGMGDGGMYGLPPAGVPVNEMTALKFGAVWSCVKIVSETVMILPWGVFEADGEMRSPAKDHAVHQLLHRRPNPEMPAYTFKQAMLCHALLQGNAYAEIERQGNGAPVALWLIDPKRVTPERDSQNTFFYKVRNANGADTAIPADDMFHLRGPSYDGLTGLSVVNYARDAISAAQATERYGATFFGNGAIPGGLVEHQADAKQITKFENAKALDNFYKSWEKRLKGPGRAHKVMYLEPGLTYKQMAIQPDDAQFIETRKLSISEICRWFRVPPHKVADLEKATFSNIEHQSKEFVEDAIIPWAIRLEQEADLKLLEGDYYSRMSVQALLRGDSKARMEYYTGMQRQGNFTINQVLGFEDINGIGPDGDVRLVPQEMTTLQRMIEGESNAVAD